MHDAYDSIPLLKLDDKVQIESITACGENLLVGTKQGHLIRYSIPLNPNEEKYLVHLIRYHKNFSRKPIQQLSLIPEYNILICLSDNVIGIYDTSSINLPPICVIQKTRGATLFTLDIKNHKTLTGEITVTVFMCVAVKRKLQFYYWKNNQFLELNKDITISDTPKALAWYDETICIGYKGEYSLLQLSSGEQKELFPTGKNPDPSVMKVADSTFALIRDSQSVFIDTNGELLVKHAVKWSEMPTAITYDDPYLIALLNETLEIRTMDPVVLHVQTINMNKAHLICRCSAGVIYIATTNGVYGLRSVPFTKQIKILLEMKQFQLALKLSSIADESPEEKSKKIYQIQTLYAYDLFNNRHYRESMKEFLKLETDPYDVIRLFPNLLPQQSRDESGAAIPEIQKGQNRDLEKGLSALIEYLTEVRPKIMESIQKKDGVDVFTKEQEQLLQIIDTTLLKCYLHTNDALIAPLLRLNHCHVAETEKILKKHRKYSELIILYQTSGLHQKALELLEKQADQQDSPLRGHERTIQYLQHLGKENIDLITQFSGWVLEKYPEDGLRIFTEDIAEIEQLPRPRVVDFLLKTNRTLLIPYLEHIINEWHDTNTMSHNALIHQYREKLLQLRSSDDLIAAQRIRTKLLKFLEESECYTPETVLTHFPFDDLYEERAIILGKLGHHEQALTIYISLLSDMEKALKYCKKMYKPNGEKGFDQVYVYLLRLLVDPPENWLVGLTPTSPPKPDIEMALKLLEEYAECIPPAKALQILPDNILINHVYHYLLVSLTKQLNDHRRMQVLKGLLFAEHLQVQERRIRYESANVFLTELIICPVCKKRFGNQSAFIRYPNGTVVHYSCQNKE